MKIPYSKIKYIKKNINISNKNLYKEIEEEKNTKNTIYAVKNSSIAFIKEENITQDNIFLIYSDEIYNLYKNVQNVIKDACNFYGIDKDINKFMMYGNAKKYEEKKSGVWYDMPGANLPFMYCIYNISNLPIEISLKNNKQQERVTLNPGDIFINKPTDLLSIKTKEDTYLLEIYLSPLNFIKNNHNGVWIPV